MVDEVQLLLEEVVSEAKRSIRSLSGRSKVADIAKTPGEFTKNGTLVDSGLFLRR